MKKQSLFILFYTYTLVCIAQNQTNIWYFGVNAGLDFNSGEPVVLTDGQIDTDEGSAVISDDNGSLLFYTDGVTVYNSQHSIMPNGTNLKGNFTSTQSALIIPEPGNDRYFYIFTTAAQGQPDGLNYTLVDMDEDNGLGDVISKNIQLYTPTTEKLTAVHHANGRDIWVITHKWESDEFYTYLITNEGLNETPVISKTGAVHEFGGSNANAAGQMKVSSSGKFLALNIFRQLKTEIFTFNNANGKIKFIENFLFISDPEEIIRLSGLEFSLNDIYIYIYISEVAPGGFIGQRIFQYNINTKEKIEIDTVFRGGSLQLTPNGEILAVNVQRDELLVIERPNLPFDHPDFSISRLNILPGKTLFGLPNFIQSYFYVPDPIVDMPNAFTPNKDGKNDVFLPITFENVETFSLVVLDRNGREVFHSTLENPWWSGDSYPSTTYYWQLNLEGVNGEKASVKGWVQLLR